METVAPIREIVEEIRQKGGEAVKFCYQCGKCDSVCPWNRVMPFSMRRLIREAAFGLTEIEKEDLWRCTTCGSCPSKCPREVRQIEDTVALRRIATDYGVFPAPARPLRTAAGSLAGEGNPLNEERRKRAKWAEGIAVPAFTEGTEYLYLPCCYLSYDGRLKKVARAVAGVLTAAGVNFGILGERENCCGESIRKTGDEDLFKHLGKENIKTFIDSGVKKILVSSPHCLHTLKNEYPEFMVRFEVVHLAQFFFGLISQGQIKIEKAYEKRVIYHDPCYLGRHNGLYDEPRRALKAIAGLELIEFAESRSGALCCGGGGGRIWMETPKGERFSDLRIKQAAEVGAQVLATCCPYCITNFEDSRLILNLAEELEIKDLAEILEAVI